MVDKDRERVRFYQFYYDDFLTNKAIVDEHNVKNLEEAVDIILDYFTEDFDFIINNNDYKLIIIGTIYRLYEMNKNSMDNTYLIKSLFKKLFKLSKSKLKPYYKEKIEKDGIFDKCVDLKNKMEAVIDEIDYSLAKESEQTDEFKVIETIIFDLKNPDYLFRFLQVKPDIVNITNNEKISLFKYLCDYYLDSIYVLSNEDTKYFKRIIMIFLESDNLHVKNSDLYKIIDKCNFLNSINYHAGIDFLKISIERHFPNLSGNSKINCVTFTQIDTPFDIVSKDPGNRVDLRDVFTITIDGFRNKRLDNTLFDDAFAITGSGNDIHILVSVPDVDMIIERDSEIDNFMRSLGESVYKREYKKPLLDYRFARELSLEKGKDRYALTFDINVDSDANVKGIDFYESIVRVNYNLTKDKADSFMLHNKFDPRLYVLNKMYDLAVKLCRKRKEVVGRRSPARVIMDEFNLLPDLQTAKYFESNGIIFPYKNYAGKLKNNSRKNIKKVSDFLSQNNLNEESSELLNSVFYIYNRVFYDTINYGNKEYKGSPCGSVGNPLREYIALETDRLIKDLIIHNGNPDNWEERIERDCIEFTEINAKLGELYKEDIRRGR